MLHPLRYKKKVIKGNVHRVFSSTSTLEKLDEPLEVNPKNGLDDHYPESWSSRVAWQNFENIREEGKQKEDG